MADLSITNHGSICLLSPESPAGEDWIAEHIPADAQTWGHAIVVEPRYIDAIVAGAQSDGLWVS